MIKLLMQNGAKYLSKDSYKRSPLIYAVINGHSNVASFLLRNGAEF